MLTPITATLDQAPAAVHPLADRDEYGPITGRRLIGGGDDGGEHGDRFLSRDGSGWRCSQSRIACAIGAVRPCDPGWWWAAAASAAAKGRPLRSSARPSVPRRFVSADGSRSAANCGRVPGAAGAAERLRCVL